MSEDHRPAYVPKKYATYREYLDYKKVVNARYAKTEKGRANTARQNASPLAQERYARYRQTEKYRESQRRYHESAKWKETSQAGSRRAREEAPEKVAARYAIQYALAKGTIAKPVACSRCDRVVARLQAHHHLGYDQPHWLDVTWLCGVCHKAEHPNPRGPRQ